MTPGTKTALVTGGGLVGGVLLGFLLVRRKVLQRCKVKVKAACKGVPLMPDSVCDNMAKGICVGGAPQPRGARRRRGVSHVSQGNAMAGSIGGRR